MQRSRGKYFFFLVKLTPSFFQLSWLIHIWLSNHNLLIETGRHKKGKWERRREMRIWSICHDGIEDEVHFLFYCPIYRVVQKKQANLKKLSFQFLCVWASFLRKVETLYHNDFFQTFSYLASILFLVHLIICHYSIMVCH